MKECDCQTKKYQEFKIYNEFYNSLSPIHVIRTLMEEHQVILNFCEALETFVKKIKKTSSLNDAQMIIINLQFISAHLLRAEKHHIREEYTFIRRLVEMAEFEPSQGIRKQHDKLWVLKRKLESTLYGVYSSPYNEFLKELQLVSRQLISMLRNHIETENNILYPQAIKLIPDKKQWHKMHTECQNIGYCCFTPVL